MKSNTATKPKTFISPLPVVMDQKIQIEFDYHKCDKLEGYLIDLMNDDEKTSEVFFLPTTKSDVEDWIYANGEVDTDFEYEKEWDDSEGERGGWVSKKQIIEDNWNDNVREYIIEHSQEWRQHE